MPHYLARSPDPVASLFGPTPVLPQALAVNTNAFVQFAFQSVFLFIGLYVLYQMILGAIDWISSQGDEKKLSNARGRIQNAVIGLVLSLVVVVAWTLVAGDILGIIKRCPDGSWAVKTPTLGSTSAENPCLTPQ